jgi:CheY-like chemotaxis protein
VEKRKSILLCDDNLLNRKLVIAMLQNSPYSVIETETGRDGLNYVLANHEHISLFLLDINMKDINGIEICRRIRETDQDMRNRLTIIAYTAHAMAEEHQRYLNAGFDGVLTKPAVQQDVLQLLAKYIT